MPLLIVFAYVGADQLYFAWKKRRAFWTFVLSASLIFLIVQFWVLSFHLLPSFQKAINLGPLGWIDYVDTGDIIVKYPQPDNTPNKDILNYFNQNNTQSLSLMIGIDQPDINPSTLDFFISI